MSFAAFPDGHTEEVRNASLDVATQRLKDALKRGATEVRVFPESAVPPDLKALLASAQADGDPRAPAES